MLRRPRAEGVGTVLLTVPPSSRREFGGRVAVWYHT